MAETWEDYGDLAMEERYQRKSTLGKIFSGRTLKKCLKGLLYLLVFLVYGLLFFRLCTGKPPAELSSLLWTESVHMAYSVAGDDFVVYEQTPIESIAKDGYFSVSDVRYIPSASSFQLTVRYNNSSIEALESWLIDKETVARRNALKAEYPELSKTEIEEKLAEDLATDPIVIEDLGKTPFLFVLRDDYGNVYADYSYIHESKTVYQYLRISYENVELFGSGTQTLPEKQYPSPDPALDAYIYKGPHTSEGGEIHYLYMDMYYIDGADVYSESFAYPLQVYTESSELTVFDHEKEIGTTPRKDLTLIDYSN